MDSTTVDHGGYNEKVENIDWAMFYQVDPVEVDPVQVKFSVQTASAVETDPNLVQESTSTNNTVNDLESMSKEFKESNKAIGLDSDTMDIQQSAPDIQQSAPAPYSSILCTNNSVGVDPVTSLKANTTQGYKTSKPTPTEADVFKSVMRNRKNASRHRILKKEKLEHLELTIRVMRVDNDTKDIRIKELTALLEGEKKTVASLRNTVWGRSV